MAITKEIVIDQITVTENGIILYREATRIIEDGTMVAQTYHRSSLQPGDDLTDKPAKVVAICDAVWTPEVIENFKQQQEAAKLQQAPSN